MKQSGLIGFFFLLLLALPQLTQAQVSVSDGTSASSYTDLSSAFNMINSGIYSGNISITITANISSVSSTASLNASGSGFANYSSVSIQPNGNYTISGSVNGPLIKLNGADNVTIDGVNSSGKSLTLINTSTGNGHVVQLTNGASGNTITNCTLKGSSTNFYGVITFTKSTGNNNNIISNNTICESTNGNPLFGILADGEGVGSSTTPTTAFSSNITIQNNNICNYSGNNNHSLGIYLLDGNANWTITDNRFYQTSSLSISNSSSSVTYFHGGIWIYSISLGVSFTISNNTIGYATSAGTGTYTVNTSGLLGFSGITLVLGSNSANVNGNSIRNISYTTSEPNFPFTGIWAASGSISVGNTAGNTVSNISLTVSSSNSYVYGIRYSASGGTIANNTVSTWNVLPGTGSLQINFYGIYNSGGSATAISGNTIGHASTANNIQIGSSGGTFTHTFVVSGLYHSSSSSIVISGNIVGGITQYSTSNTAYLNGILLNGSGAYTVNTNIIKNLTSKSSRFDFGSPSVCGILLSSSASGHTFIANTVNGLRNSSTSSSSTVVSGVVVKSYASSGTSSFYANKIYDLGVSSSTPASYCYYLNIFAGDWYVHNNMVSCSNDQNQLLVGISGGSGTCYYYYNTVYLGGTNSFNTTSAAFTRNGTGTHTLYNNILFNDRINNGANYALQSFATTGIVANYNLYVVPDTASIMSISSSSGWYNYYTNVNTTDLFSWAEKRSNLNSALLFTSASTGDLSIVTTDQVCWYVNGKGLPISGYDFDWELASGDRSAQVSDGATDIGADEFYTTKTPIAATHVGSYTAGSTSTYYFAGKKVAEITWQNGSNLPSTQPSVLYYSGVNPPYFIPGATSFNAYWHISATNPGGMSYALKLWYSDAIMGSVSSGSNLRMAKNSNGLSTGWTCASSSTSVNTGTRTFANTATYNSFSVFTGTDITNPLPVEWLYFNANKTGNDVQLGWATASESNSSYFEVQRSENGKDFISLNQVEAIGFSNTPQYYVYTDAQVPHAQTIYYRLKQVDRNGDFSYSSIRVVTDNTNNGVEVYPNPFASVLHVQTNEICRAAYVYDTQGLLKYSNFTIDSERFSLSIPYLPAGVYILKLESDSGNKMVRITRQ